MAQFVNIYKCDLHKGPVVTSLHQVFLGDVEANRVGVRVTDNGEDVTLSGTCSGTAILCNGGTVALTGTVDGSLAYVDLPSAVYTVEGPVEIYVTLTQGDQTTTLLTAHGNAVRTDSGVVIDPGTIIPSVAALISDIDDAVASIPADYSDLLGTIAPDFSSSTAYTAGQYVWYSGTLYRFTSDHAAGSWTGTDAISAEIGEDVTDLKGAIKEVGKGFSSSSANLLKTILNSIVYTSDQSQNIDDLYNAIIQTKTVQLVPIKSNTPNFTTFAYEPKSWQTALVWEPDYTITGGVMTVTFDDEIVTNFDIQVFLLDASKQPYKYAGYKNPENINVQGEWTPYLFNPGASAGFGKAAKTFSLSIPEGCYAFFCVRWNGTVYGGSEITSAGEAANWVINDDGITVVISGGVEP